MCHRTKDGRNNTRPSDSGKNWSNPASPNGAAPSLPAKFAGWFGNARKIPLSKDDENFNEKKAALAAAGFSFAKEENLWVKP